jgi:hypothetical protein
VYPTATVSSSLIPLGAVAYGLKALTVRRLVQQAALRRGWEGGGGERLQASPALSRLLDCFTGMEEEEDACKLHLLY